MLSKKKGGFQVLSFYFSHRNTYNNKSYIPLSESEGNFIALERKRERAVQEEEEERENVFYLSRLLPLFPSSLSLSFYFIFSFSFSNNLQLISYGNLLRHSREIGVLCCVCVCVCVWVCGLTRSMVWGGEKSTHTLHCCCSWRLWVMQLLFELSNWPLLPKRVVYVKIFPSRQNWNSPQIKSGGKQATESWGGTKESTYAHEGASDAYETRQIHRKYIKLGNLDKLQSAKGGRNWRRPEKQECRDCVCMKERAAAAAAIFIILA